MQKYYTSIFTDKIGLGHVKWSAEWNWKNVQNYNIYAEQSEAENFFEHFITKNLNIAPKNYI